jgi:hypothetical protein
MRIDSGIQENYPFVDSFETYRQIEFRFDFATEVVVFTVRRFRFSEPERVYYAMDDLEAS